MQKREAIALFGTTNNDLAEALGKGKSAISLWSDKLTPDQYNMVVGAAVRRGIVIPGHLIDNLPDRPKRPANVTVCAVCREKIKGA
jgi:hypothetical protein